MAYNSKIIDIFELLQKAKEEGVSEYDLFGFTSQTNTSTIKNRLKKHIEKMHVRGVLDDTVVVHNGIWYLDNNYYSATHAQVKDLIDNLFNKFNLKQISIRNNYTNLAIVVVMLMFSVWMYNLGVPDTVEQANALFPEIEFIYEYYEE